MPLASERLAGWLSPKWLVTGVALAADGMLMSYDLRLGIAASVLLGVIEAMWLYLALRYGSLSGAPSGRSALVAQVREQLDHRLLDEVPGLGIPTLENLCAYIALCAAMSDFRLSRVSVWRDGIGDRCDLRFARTLPFQV